MKVKKIKKALALLIAVVLSLSCTSVRRQVLANGGGETVFSENVDSGGVAGEDGNSGGTGDGEDGSGGEIDSNEDDNGNKTGGDEDDNDSKTGGDEDDNDSKTGGDEGDNSNKTGGDEHDNDGGAGDDEDDNGDKTGDDEDDNGDATGGDEDDNGETGEEDTKEEDENESSRDEKDGESNPGADSNMATQNSQYSIELLAALLFEYAGYTGYSEELVDWFLEGFSDDEQFMQDLYERILELIAEGDSQETPSNEMAVNFMADFFKGIYEYRNPVYSVVEESGDGGNTDEIVSAVEEFSQMIADEKEEQQILEVSANSEQTSGMSMRGASQSLYNEGGGELTYLSESNLSYLKKTVTKDDILRSGVFRHYDVELELKAYESEMSLKGQPTDIVLIIDKSGSMEGNRINAAKEAAVTFVEGLSSSSGKLIGDLNIGVVAYAEYGTGPAGTTTRYLDNNASNIKSFINGISANGGTNTQYAILEARRLLGLVDGDASPKDGRKKIIVMLSDGVPTFRQTDRWTQTLNGYYYNYFTIYQDTTRPGTGYTSQTSRRWSFTSQLSPNNTVQLRLADSNTTIYNDRVYDGNEWLNLGYGNASDVVTNKITLLEAQYAVGQGIDMYTVDFSGDGSISSLMREMTYAMTDIPTNSNVFLAAENRGVNFAPGISVNENNYSGKRAYSANNADELRGIYEEIKKIVQGQMTAFAVTDELADNFELIPNADLIATDGTALYDTTNNIVNWNIQALQPSSADANGNYTIATLRYRVRVIDMDVWHTGAGLEGSDTEKQPLANVTNISYMPVSANTLKTVALAKQPLMRVDPLIDGSAFIKTMYGDEGAILEGETIDLYGEITNGNTEFYYQWYMGTGSGKRLIEGANGTIGSGNDYGNGLHIPVTNSYTVDLKPSDDSSYTLCLHDMKASAAGYSNSRVLGVERIVQVLVYKPKLTIKVIGDNIDGRFETRVTRTPKGYITPDRQWYFMGLDTKEYTLADGIVRGTYTAESYVPYGYDVTTADPVTITLTKSEGGSYTGYQQEITLSVSDTDPWYFYDWDWPEDRREVTMADMGALPLMAALIPSRRAKKRRWFR